jgi:hypothetical protein
VNDRSIALLREALETAERDAREGATLIESTENTFDDLQRGRGSREAIRSTLDRFKQIVSSWDYPPTFEFAADPADINSGTVLHELLLECYETDKHRALNQLIRAIAAAVPIKDVDRNPVAKLREALENRDGNAFRRALKDLREYLDGHANEAMFETLRDEFTRRLEERDERFDVLAEDERVPLFEVMWAAACRRRRDPKQFRAAINRFRDAVVAINDVAKARRKRLDEVTDTSKPLPGLENEPIVLLPVRLETKFDQVGDDRTLQIRMYPDEIHIDTHEQGLTPDEIEWGTYFWQQVWWASHAVPTDRLSDVAGEEVLANVDLKTLPDDPAERYEAVKERVWTQLVERYNRERAAWIKRALSPPNAEMLLDGPHPPEQLVKPDFERIAACVDRRPSSWTETPLARLLPDRWMVFVQTVHGIKRTRSKSITKPLPVGPTPDLMAGTGITDSKEGDSVREFIEGPTDWLFDFEAAKRSGMAVEVELTEDEAQAGVDVLAIGVDTTKDSEAAAAALGDLLDAHHYTNGLSIVPRGTPTNHTKDASAGSEPDPGTVVECGPSLVSQKSDGEHLARALALQDQEEHIFNHVAGAGQTDERDAATMNTALWSATLGYAIPHLFSPNSWSPGTPRTTLIRWLDVYRQHFVSDVRSSPLPTLRIGNQPYGVLPTTDLSRWDYISQPNDDPEPPSETILDEFPRRFAPPSTEAFERDLVGRVQELRHVWERGIEEVPSLAPASIDKESIAETLVELLGMEGVPFHYRLRYLGSVTALAAFHSGRSGPFNHAELARLQSDERIEELLKESEKTASKLEKLFKWPTGDVPQLARQLFASRAAGPVTSAVDDRTPEFIAMLRRSSPAMLRRQPGSRIYLDRIWEGLEQVKGLEFEFFRSEQQPSLLSLLLYYASLQEYVLARVRLGHLYWAAEDFKVDRPDNGWYLLPEPKVRGQKMPTLWSTLEERIPEQSVGPSTTTLWNHPAISRDSTYGSALQTAPEIDESFDEFQQALGILESEDPDDLEQLLWETIGLVNHRLDAWATSIATRRLRQIRSNPATDNGIYVGAYGWVENLKPRTRPPSNGYVHAPSMSQATTAAVLHSGYRAHDGEAFSVDLSPDRVQDGLQLIEGVRNSGRPLGELLGYRFERSLNEKHPDIELDKYVPEFRVLAPITADAIDRDDERKAIDRTALRDRIDGLELYRIWQGDHADKHLPWGESIRDDGVKFPDTDTTEHAAIETELQKLGAAIDAVTDILTAESVHQLIHDNPEAAAGSLDALSRGEAPPHPSVTRVPQSGIGVTHRLLALFKPRSAPAELTSPHVRSAAEPTLAAWFEIVVGDLHRVPCLVEYEVLREAEPKSESESTPESILENIETELATETESEPRRKHTVIRLSELALEPLDILYLQSGDGSKAKESELEQRIKYHLRRDESRAIAPDGEISITFTPPSEWPIAPRTFGVDPSATIGVGELFEMVDRTRRIVTAGRSLDARDLVRPEEAGDRRLEEGELVDRLEVVRPRLVTLGEDIMALGGLFRSNELATGADATTRIDQLVAIQEAIDGAVATFGKDNLETLATLLAQLQADAILEDLMAVLKLTRGEQAVLETDEKGVVIVEPGPSQQIRGMVNVPAETSFQVIIESSDKGHWKVAEAEVQDDGIFVVQFDFSDAEPETEFIITVRRTHEHEEIYQSLSSDSDERTRGNQREPSIAEFEGRISETKGTVALRPVGPALTSLLRCHTSFTELSAVTEPLRTALADADIDEIEAATARLEGAGGATARINEILSLASLSLPGFDESGEPFMSWHRLVPLLEAIISTDSEEIHRLDISSFDVIDKISDSTTRKAFQSDLESLLTVFTDSVKRVMFAEGSPPDVLESLRAVGLEAIRERLFHLTYFGIHGSVPRSAVGTTDEDVATLTQQAASVEREINRRLDDASEIDDPVERLETLFDDGFRVLAPFKPDNSDEVRNMFAADHRNDLQNSDPLAAETWLQRVARVRDRPRAFRSALTYAEIVGDLEPAGVRVTASQLPYESPDTWVGLPDAWPETDEDRQAGKVSLVTYLESPETVMGPRLVGLFVDEWVETVPNRSQTTGLSFHFNRPNTQPPQSLLIAVTPDGNPWTYDMLRDIVCETRLWSKLRTVDREALPDVGHLLPPLYYARNSSTGPSGLDTPSLDFQSLLELRKMDNK